jgi:hypothetical protein
MTDCGQNALSTFLKMKLPGWEDADPAGIRAEGFRHPWETLQDIQTLTDQEEWRLIETHLEHQLQPADATHSAPTSAIHAPCLVHQLQLVVSDGLAAIQVNNRLPFPR